MKINEYGNRDKPHIILIHGMWMCHELMLPYVAPFKDDYHIIAPDLTGHGNDKGQFISAEKDAEELASWLSANGMREIDLMFSSSLGGVVAMYLATSKEDIHIKCNVMEGASLTRVPLIEPLFRIMIPCILLFTGIGIYAIRREKPMWFWSGSTVNETEITDVKSYNKENGIMWICYSLVMWASTFMGVFNMAAAGIVLFIGGLAGLPILVICYNRIYKKYKKK